MANIKISGSTGFVGKNLATYLNNKKVIGVERSALILFESALFNDCEVFIHLAAKVHDLKKNTNLEEYYQVNFELTKNLYDAFLKSNAKKFIFVSSVKAAADAITGVLTEDHVPSPQTHYGKSKLMAEEYIQAQVLPAGKSYYILRPCMIHGPGNKGNLNLLYNLIRKSLPYPLALFKNKRSFLSIDNLCFIVNELIENDIPSGIYNTADDEPLETNDVVRILAKSLNKTPKLWFTPKPIIFGLVKIAEVLKIIIVKDRLNKLTDNYIVSNNKIKQAIGKQLPLSSKEGLEITAKSFKLKK